MGKFQTLWVPFAVNGAMEGGGESARTPDSWESPGAAGLAAGQKDGPMGPPGGVDLGGVRWWVCTMIFNRWANRVDRAS